MAFVVRRAVVGVRLLLVPFRFRWVRRCRSAWKTCFRRARTSALRTSRTVATGGIRSNGTSGRAWGVLWRSVWHGTARHAPCVSRRRGCRSISASSTGLHCTGRGSCHDSCQVVRRVTSARHTCRPQSHLLRRASDAEATDHGGSRRDGSVCRRNDVAVDRPDLHHASCWRSGAVGRG